MAKITLTSPFFVFVLSVLTALLLWQDVSAQQTSSERAQRNTSRTTDTAPPVEAPTEAEVVAEAEPAQEPGRMMITIDGETHSFAVEKCSVFERGHGSYQVNGRAVGDDGSTLVLKFVPGTMMIGIIRTLPDRINIDYINTERNADVFRVDGSTVTVDGAFKTMSPPITGHSIQMSFDCSG